jgi:hypothetical protein
MARTKAMSFASCGRTVNNGKTSYNWWYDQKLPRDADQSVISVKAKLARD